MKITVKGGGRRIRQDFQNMVSKEDAREVGEKIQREMITLITKGISPIRGVGRFAEYVGVSRYRAASQKATALRKKVAELEAMRLNPAKAKSLKAMISRTKDRAAQEKKKAYPFSVQSKYPGKRQRPVNLLLSGHFLRNLKVRIRTGFKSGFAPEVFYEDTLAQKKELGHREGANGQAKRPTIPIQGEQIAVSLERIIMEFSKMIIGKFLK